MTKLFTKKNVQRTLLPIITILCINIVQANAKSVDLTNLNTDLSNQGVQLKYSGGFRVNLKEEGASRSGYAQGTFTLSEDSKSFYMVGHVHHQSIAQYALPTIVESENIKDLKITGKAIQPYTKLLGRAHTGNKQKLNRITGMELIEGELFVNAVEYYDANTNNSNTTLIIREPTNMAKSKIDGYFDLKGAAHSAGWISKLPKKWEDKLQASYLMGFASNYPINSRSSIGPTAFVYYLDNFAQTDLNSGFVPARPILDYSLKHPLNKRTGENNLWTDVSEAIYGFVIPGTDYYLVIGQSGGHESGVGYKITQNTGRVCGGPCPRDQNDVYHHYWIWDMNELLTVDQNKIMPHEPKPIHYGTIQMPFQPSRGIYDIAGADFDRKHNKLYVLISNADRLQSKYEGAPIMAIFDLLKLQ
jgi:hypothetical protein